MTFRNRFSNALNSDHHQDQTGNNNNNKNNVNSSYKSKSLKVHICTWNVNTKQPTEFDIGDLLKHQSSLEEEEDDTKQPDVCVFGFQEVNSKPWQRVLDYFNYDPWTNALTDLLSGSNSGKYGDYVRLQSTRLVGIIMNVFVRRDLLPHVRRCSTDLLRLGFFGLWGNKGANIVSLNIGGFDISLVNAHLSAHTHLKQLRKLEYARIMSKKVVQLGPKTSDSGSHRLRDEDYLLFFGDLNFRCESLSQAQVAELIENKQYDRLLESDQLRQSMAKEKEFGLFDEPDITFPPSYKYKVGTNEYDTSKSNRLPSWCDRILFQTKENTNKNSSEIVTECKPSSYEMLPEFLISDHKPVRASFDLQVSDWSRERRQVEFVQIRLQEENNLEVEYHVNNNKNRNKITTITHGRDWIGVYPAKFKHTHDYASYVWSPRVEELEKEKNDDRTQTETRPTKRAQYNRLEKVEEEEEEEEEEDEEEEDEKKKPSDNKSNSNECFSIKRSVVIRHHQLPSLDDGSDGLFVLGYYSYLFDQIIGVSEPFAWTN